MNKTAIAALVTGGILAIGCGQGSKPTPKPTSTPSETVAPIKASEQQCFDDVVEALRETQQTHQYKRPDTCNNLAGGEHRYRQIHELALLKVTANG